MQRYRLTCAAFAVFAVFASSSAHADDLGDFIKSRPELASISPLPSATSDQVEVRVGPNLRLFARKVDSQWVGILVSKAGSDNLGFGTIIPSKVGASFSSGVMIIANSAGTLKPSTLASGDLKTALSAVAKDDVVSWATGANVQATLTATPGGALAKLAKAGVLPTTTLWLTGTLGPGLAQDDLGATSSKDYSMSLSISTGALSIANTISAKGATITLERKKTDSQSQIALTGTLAKVKLADRELESGTITFTDKETSYAITASLVFDWQNAFGINGFTISRVDIGFENASGAYGVTLAVSTIVGGKPFTGEIEIRATGSTLQELTLALKGSINLGFITELPDGASVSINDPFIGVQLVGGKSGFIGGTVSYKTVTGTGAAMIGTDTIAVFIKTSTFRLQDVAKKLPAAIPPLPATAVMLVAKAKPSLTLAALPSRIAAVFDSMGAGDLTLAPGFSLVTSLSPKVLGFDADSTKGLVTMPSSMRLAGAFSEKAVSLSAALPGFQLQTKGFGVKDPSFILNWREGGTPAVGVQIDLLARFDRQPIDFQTALTVAADGTVAGKGVLVSDWRDPLGIKGLAIERGTGMEISVGPPGVGFGVNGNLKISGQRYSGGVCMRFGPAAGVPDGFGMHFDADLLDARTELAMIQGLLNSMVSGPLMNGIPDKKTRLLLAKAKLDGIDRMLDGLPVPSIKMAKFALATPNNGCTLGGMDQMGAAIAGTLSFRGVDFASLDAGFNLARGIWFGASAKAFTIGPLALSDTKFDLGAPMPTGGELPHLLVKGSATLLGLSAKIDVQFDKTKAKFDFASKIEGVGEGAIHAESIGPDLDHLTDFQLALAASFDLAGVKKKLLSQLGPSLQKNATQRKSDYAKVHAKEQKATDTARVEFEKIDKKVGRDLRRLQRKADQAEAAWNACTKSTPTQCKDAIAKLLNAKDVLDAFESTGDYAKWVVAAAKYESVKYTYAAVGATLGAYDNVLDIADETITGVLDEGSPLAIDNISFDGKLSTGRGKLAIDARIANLTLNTKFDVVLGPGIPPDMSPIASQLVDAYLSSGSSKTSNPGQPTITTLTVKKVNKASVIKATVTYTKPVKQVDGDVMVKGSVTLYKRGLDGVGVAVAHQFVNSRDDKACSDTDTAYFNSTNCDSFVGGGTSKTAFKLTLDPGVNVFYAMFNGDGQYALSNSSDIVINN